MNKMTNINDAVNYMYHKVVEESVYEFMIPCEIESGDGVIKEIQLVMVEPRKFELCIITDRFYHRNYYYGEKKVRKTMTMLHNITKNRDGNIDVRHFYPKTIKIVTKGR